MNYKTIRYPGHCEQMRLLMNDLKLNHDRATLKRILENAVPQTLQDVVIVYAAVTGTQDGRAARRELRQQDLPADDRGPPVVGDPGDHRRRASPPWWIWCCEQKGRYQGFVAQEQFRLTEILANRFGRYYAPGGTKDLSGDSRRRRQDRPPAPQEGRQTHEYKSRSERRAVAAGTRRARTRAPGPARPAGPRAPTAPLVNVRNPADGALLAQVRPRQQQRLRGGHGLRRGRRGGLARGAGAQARRGRPPARRGAAPPQERPRHAWSRSRTARSWPRALGEVQEMIDIADFAVGQSRMLYGLTMHSERPQHRMYEQWHPLGRGRHHLRVQLPGRGVVLERVPRARSAATPASGSPRPRRRCARSPCRHLCNKVHGSAASCRRSSSCSSMSGTDLADALRGRPARGAGLLHRLHRRSAARSASASPRASARACSSSAATTRSSSMRPRTSTWRCPPSCSARSARPASAARRTRRVFVHKAIAARNSSGAWCTPTSRCASAIRSRTARSWVR